MSASIPDRVRERLPFLQQGTRLVEPHADAPAHAQKLRAGGDAERGGLAVVRKLAQERAHPPPVVRRGGEVGAPHPLGRAPVPARGAERLAGLLPVMRQQRGALVEMLGVLPLDRARHRGVHLAAPLAELAAERHLLRQRMLEGVLGHRVERLLVDELGAAQRRQRRLQLVGGQLRHCRQQRLGEVLADHRRDLQQPLLALRQPIDARRQHRLHGRRHLEPLDRRHQPVGAARALRDAPTRSATAPPPR